MYSSKNTYLNVLIAFVAIVAIVSITTFSGYSGQALSDAANRNLETIPKLWLNGYFGVFFNYKWVGVLAVLFPIAILLYKPESKNKAVWIAGIILALILFLIVGTQFYINGRYQLTLYIIFSWIGIILLKKIIRSEKKYRFLIFVFLTLNLLNTGIQLVADYLPRYQKRIENIGADQVQNTKLNYVQFLNDSIPQTSFFLVNNLPEFYYHSNLKGLYCWTYDNIYFNQSGKHTLFFPENTSLTDSIIQHHHIEYYFSTKQFDAFNPDFHSYIQSKFNLIFDDGHYLIYRLKPLGER